MLENIQYFEPTRFMGVTRIFEKIEEGVRTREAELTGLKARVFGWAQRQALHHHKLEEAGKPHSSLGYSLAQRLVFNKVSPTLQSNASYLKWPSFRFISRLASRGRPRTVL